MSDFTFDKGRNNVHSLDAGYDFLCKAFGRDGTVDPRDDYKSMAEWDIQTPHGEVQVYDYKVGKCYDSDGLEREDIRDWHVQGDDKAIDAMLTLLKNAS